MVIGIQLMSLLLGLGAIGAIVYVSIHFISKVW